VRRSRGCKSAKIGEVRNSSVEQERMIRSSVSLACKLLGVTPGQSEIILSVIVELRSLTAIPGMANSRSSHRKQPERSSA